MSSAFMRGRTLDPDAVKKAREWRGARIEHLQEQLANGQITIKERRELKYKWCKPLG